MGVEQVVVVINKMDAKDVNYSQSRFAQIQAEMGDILTGIGYKTRRIPFIPVSALQADNIAEKSTRMDWWEGFAVTVNRRLVTGFTLIDAMEQAIRPPKRYIDKPFRLAVSNVLKIKGVGDVITGRARK